MIKFPFVGVLLRTVAAFPMETVLISQLPSRTGERTIAVIKMEFITIALSIPKSSLNELPIHTAYNSDVLSAERLLKSRILMNCKVSALDY